jgi:hypothetical protein
MSDNRRRCGTIKQALKQQYPEESGMARQLFSSQGYKQATVKEEFSDYSVHCYHPIYLTGNP